MSLDMFGHRLMTTTRRKNRPTSHAPYASLYSNKGNAPAEHVFVVRGRWNSTSSRGRSETGTGHCGNRLGEGLERFKRQEQFQQRPNFLNSVQMIPEINPTACVVRRFFRSQLTTLVLAYNSFSGEKIPMTVFSCYSVKNDFLLYEEKQKLERKQ